MMVGKCPATIAAAADLPALVTNSRRSIFFFDIAQFSLSRSYITLLSGQRVCKRRLSILADLTLGHFDRKRFHRSEAGDVSPLGFAELLNERARKFRVAGLDSFYDWRGCGRSNVAV